MKAVLFLLASALLANNLVASDTICTFSDHYDRFMDEMQPTYTWCTNGCCGDECCQDSPFWDAGRIGGIIGGGILVFLLFACCGACCRTKAEPRTTNRRAVNKYTAPQVAVISEGTTNNDTSPPPAYTAYNMSQLPCTEPK